MAKKALISLLLLLTYSLGFAHNFIPHSHDTDTEAHLVAHEKGEHHHHHHAVKHSESNHKHVSHGDHYDKGFYDLLLCFMHDSHDHQNDCKDQHYIPAKTNTVTMNKFQANKLVAVLFSFDLEIEKSEFTSDHYFNSDIAYLSPSIEDTPLRGPPSNS